MQHVPYKGFGLSRKHSAAQELSAQISQIYQILGCPKRSLSSDKMRVGINISYFLRGDQSHLAVRLETACADAQVQGLAGQLIARISVASCEAICLFTRHLQAILRRFPAKGDFGIRVRSALSARSVRFVLSRREQAGAGRPHEEEVRGSV